MKYVWESDERLGRVAPAGLQGMQGILFAHLERLGARLADRDQDWST